MGDSLLQHYTSYYGEARLDVTVKGQDPLGRHFAPTWEMLRAWQSRTLNNREYTHQYYELMRDRFRVNREPWIELLAKSRIVLVCFEKPEENFCHRFILANILQKMGAKYEGELNVDGSFWGNMDLSAFEDSELRITGT